MTDGRVLVVGAGIGGLTLAAALERVGIPFTLFERAPRLNDVGAGIQLAPNAVKSLREVGLRDELDESGCATDSFEFWSHRGRKLCATPVGTFARKHDAPLLFISRPVLLRLLASRVPPESIRLGSSVESVSQDPDGATVRLADGGEERGAIVVGADGLRSSVRRALFGERPLRFGGYQDWRAAVEYETDALPPATFRLFFGPGIRAGMGRAGGGLMFWYVTGNADAGTTKDEHGGKAGLLARLQAWPAPVEELIGATPEQAFDLADNYELRPLERWTDGRVTLLGDAAHGMTTNVGRGGSESIEDAVTLASTLAAGGDLGAALAEYEQRRRPTVEAVRKRAWQLGRLGSLSSPVACTVRSTMLRTSAPVVSRQIEADFAHDVARL